MKARNYNFRVLKSTFYLLANTYNGKRKILMDRLLDGLKKRVLKDVMMTTVYSTIGKGAGFLVPFFIAAWFGVSAETDAFFLPMG